MNSKILQAINLKRFPDVNECSYTELNACPEKGTCANLEGYYSCDPQHKHAHGISHQLSQKKEDPSAVTSHQIFSVTSNSFEMSWHVTSTLNHTFQVQVLKGTEIVQDLKTEEMKMDVSQLEAGVMHSVVISYETCGKTIISHRNVKTDWDECASHTENDCSVFAECINGMGSYMCRCKTTMDTNPSRPGRNYEGEIVDLLAEMMAPEIRNSTELASEEGSPAVLASPAATETVASSQPLGDKQVSHSLTSAPSVLWKKAVQKLSGTVQITNVIYSPDFSNTSSEEYQTFAQLFVDEVHKSLTLDVLQQVDAGLIKVLITGITNGSTVVNFNLLVAEDVDIYSIITTFHDALEHNSHFTIDRSSLSIRAFPISQKATATDEKPVHNIVLPVTSLQTSTHVSSPASLDFSATEHKALEDTIFPSTVLPPLTKDLLSTPDISPQASPIPLAKPAQESSIKDANMTNTIVKTILRNDISAQGIIHHLKVASPIHCVFQNDVLASSGYAAEGLYTIFEDLHGSGHFRIEMQLFIGNSQIPKKFSISASDDVLIEVGIQRGDSKLKRCHAMVRFLKTGEIISTQRTSWGPLCKSPASDLKREKEAGMGVGYIILIALAVVDFVGFVLGVVSLLIFQYQRKMGRYNFRIKSDNFSYQVFYD
ncbi:hypothetical protein WISP_50673 [Willisornis vidua]|uniref:SEA domain-containing protein n=1 Tax=Willisornis vidua TaxID=1566151 RepID=A0ABQ9DEH1_9PASS|nr:hypothetical protein WISP_50673 [Willisornis vidua]